MKDLPTTAMMFAKEMLRQEHKYIEEMLKACNEAMPIKSYAVVREDSFEELKEEIDKIIEHNPMMEIAGPPIDLKMLNVEKWLAVLVEYEDKH